MVVFLQRWPCYLQKNFQSELGTDFITKNTIFYGDWKPAERIDPRALDVGDINDQMMGEILIRVLEKKGYQAFLADAAAENVGRATVGELMAAYQALDPSVNAFLFCFYSPTLYLSHAKLTPPDHRNQPYSLEEIVQILAPGDDGIIWGGRRADLSPERSMSHASVFLSVACFRALDWKPFWEAADSQTGGDLRPWLPQCFPVTDLDYWADAAIIQRLMCQNLTCRLRQIIPFAF